MTTILTILAGLASLHWLARIGEALRARSSPFRVREGQYTVATDGELVSVLIPARDEEANIARCLRSVLAQDHPRIEVIVLDDRSTDRTGAIVDGFAAQDQRVRRVAGEPLPAGWKGKCHALHQASAGASGSWLLMIDADVELAPGALTAALGAASALDAEMVSWFARQRVVTSWERVLQPLILDFILTHSDPRRVNDPACEDCIANGQFLMVRTEVYREVGGHEPVCDSIVEDMAFSRLIKSAGFRYRLLDGVDVMWTRMYASLGEIWRGWTKNFFAGLHGRRGVVVAALVYLVFTGVLPFALLAIAIASAACGAPAPWFLALSGVSVTALYAYRLAIIRRTVPPSLLGVLLHPLAAVVLGAIIVESTRRAATGAPVSWKGRDYDAGGDSARLP